MNPTTIGLLIFITLLVLLFHRLILEWGREVLPLLRKRLNVALPTLTGLARSALRWAGRLVTHEGELSPSQAAIQVATAALFLGALVTFGLCDYAFAYATLSGLFGIPPRQTLSGFDWLLGLSAVLLAVVFGSIITDLRGWTSGRFAGIERGRALANCGAWVCFVMSLAVGAALALYRFGVLKGESGAWFESLPAVILVALAVLLLIGTAAAFMQCESSFPALLALSVAVGGLGLGAVWFILLLIDFAAEILEPAVKTTLQRIEKRDNIPPKRKSYELPIEGSAVPTNTVGSNSSEGSPHNLEVPAPVGLQAGELGQRPDPNGGPGA